MTKNGGVDKNELAAKALSIMNDKKITLCVYEKKINLKQLEYSIFITYYNRIFLNE